MTTKELRTISGATYGQVLRMKDKGIITPAIQKVGLRQEWDWTAEDAEKAKAAIANKVGYRYV